MKEDKNSHSFLCMDMFTKRFGAKPAIKLSLLAIVINLFSCGVFYIFSKVGNNWSAFYKYNDEIANLSLNDTFGGTWYVLLGSTIAMTIASVVNAIINQAIGNKLKKKKLFAIMDKKMKLGSDTMNFKINEFEGPLDLLLHLIKENKMDIMNIEIERITEQYISYLDEQEKIYKYRKNIGGIVY